MGLFSKAATSFSQASQKLKFKVKGKDVFYLCSGFVVGFAVLGGYRLKIDGLESQAQRLDDAEHNGAE